ncbi:MAG: hypothetical protein UX99_C0003G0034 [Candidatus Amesbacteria bacterium GW2011_GWB1_47_26]|uniref:Uncharacterized protein n=1 Tax=Candidatus Amesbacteria bacterium GW2011_GWC2_45_19 TaxID=1618366 RepID=A0A0G1Q3E2_9BACT|nr:MAG: hypothetical protein UX05_C0003G0034 [Candidatus Amesbacteria bacterium GW2011_GWC2_45_19]KKU38654.1 MAG: hypothetical protein UX52_C0002G0034 [Candidatus Amesbacteria bacterium GW2011_GWA1_46_35]KKU68641.1 MAG: hypothetical protein UX93_C0006G0058 [Microgenomates group bacterium GW2011_GWC1_47_20]KKU74974.1 MAG: hypothetical protein UX99_C0003G0034 [Candidatus Amesbacteria bacterium GW2011_GWB1_47_26]
MTNTENRIILGDQSPWTGGWLRMQAVAAAGLPYIYLVQDADAPWKQNGSSTPSTKNGWTDYWSLASKNPWSPSVPGVEIGNVRSFHKAPSGLSHLTGPNTSQTIHSERQNYHLASLVKDLLIREANWARTVGAILGIAKESDYRANQWIDALQSCHTIDDIYRSMGHAHGIDRHQSLVDFFSNNPPLLINELGKHRYWSIDNRGHRHEYSRHPDGVVVPKGKALVLELCAQGFVLAYTGLGYLDKQIELRDQYVPGLMLKLLQISFVWSLSPEPLPQLVNEFAQSKLAKHQTVDIRWEEVEGAQRYWAGRPTTISQSILGGDLNPLLNYQVL